MSNSKAALQPEPVSSKNSAGSQPAEGVIASDQDSKEPSLVEKPKKGVCPCAGDCPKCLPVKDLEASKGILELSEEELNYLEGQPTNKPGLIPVKIGSLAKGFIPVQVVAADRSLKTPGGTGKMHALEIQNEHLKSLSGLGIRPVLAVQMTQNKVWGFLSAAVGDVVLQSKKDLVQKIKNNPVGIGLSGVKMNEMEGFDNEFKDGLFAFGLNGVAVKAYLFDGTAGLKFTNEGLSFDGFLKAKIPGLQESQVRILRNPKGQIYIHGSLAANMGPAFSGAVVVDYLDGVGKIDGKLTYTTEKLSGELNVIVADPASAQAAMQAAIGPENIVNQASPEQKQDPNKKDPTENGLVLAGYGDVTFKFNDWLSGRTKVVFDHRGYVTVIGAILLPPEIPLVPGKNFSTPPVGPMAKAFYGIPWVAEVYVAGGLSFNTYAVIAPLTLRSPVIEGLYSTDPKVLQHFNIKGNLNVSAEAGMSLSLWVKVGASILFHDVSLMGTLKSTAGIRAYADTQLALGYQEKQDPVLGKKGDFIFTGMFEFAAQPFLRLQGDLQYNLDAPMISPVSDANETWPFLDWFYPIPATLGMKFGLKDYVIGTDPNFTFEMGQVDFDTDKFLESAVEKQKTAEPAQKPVTINSKIPGAAPAPQTATKPAAPTLLKDTAPKKLDPPKTPVAAKQPKSGKGQKVAEKKGQVVENENTDFIAYTKDIEKYAKEIEKRKEPYTLKQIQGHINRRKESKKYQHTYKDDGKGSLTLGLKGKAPKVVELVLKCKPHDVEEEPKKTEAKPTATEPKELPKQDEIKDGVDPAYTDKPVPKSPTPLVKGELSTYPIDLHCAVWRMYYGKDAAIYSKTEYEDAAGAVRYAKREQSVRPTGINQVTLGYTPGADVPPTMMLLERLSNEARGHMVGEVFGGPSKVPNLVPQSADNSSGPWWTRERVAQGFYAGTIMPNIKGNYKKVLMSLDIKYPGENTRRPNWITMKTKFLATIKGKEEDVTLQVYDLAKKKWKGSTDGDVHVDNKGGTQETPTPEELAIFKANPMDPRLKKNQG